MGSGGLVKLQSDINISMWGRLGSRQSPTDNPTDIATGTYRTALANRTNSSASVEG